MLSRHAILAIPPLEYNTLIANMASLDRISTRHRNRYCVDMLSRHAILAIPPLEHNTLMANMASLDRISTRHAILAIPPLEYNWQPLKIFEGFFFWWYLRPYKTHWWIIIHVIIYLKHFPIMLLINPKFNQSHHYIVFMLKQDIWVSYIGYESCQGCQ